MALDGAYVINLSLEIPEVIKDTFSEQTGYLVQDKFGNKLFVPGNESEALNAAQDFLDNYDQWDVGPDILSQIKLNSSISFGQLRQPY